MTNDEDVALARVREWFPELGAQRAVLLGGRLVRSFLVDGAIVFRFPIDRDAAAMLAAEVRLTRALAPHVPVAIPDHRYHAPGTSDLLPFWGHPALLGSPASSVVHRAGPEKRSGARQGNRRVADPSAPRARTGEVVDDRCEDLGAKLGHALAAIHAFPIATAWACGIRQRRAPHHNLAALYRDLTLQYDRVRSNLPPKLRVRCERYFAQMAVPPPHVGVLGLIHGSISRQTVHVAEPIGLAAWEEVNIGDVAVDLGCVLFAFGRSALDAAVGTMKQSVGLAERARFIARCYGLSLVADPTTPIAAKAWGLESDRVKTGKHLGWRHRRKTELEGVLHERWR